MREMTEPMTAYCPHFHRAMGLLARRWTPEIVRALLAGNTRFTDIATAIPGLSDRLLSERLKDLESDGVLTRSVLPQTPVRVEYRLTEKGEALGGAIRALATWAEAWVPVDPV
jgi:DNA-binding HxlR family transcriptional regulator